MIEMNLRKKIIVGLLMAPMLLNAQNSDSIDVASLTVVYDYSVKTTDADGVPVRDAMQLAVQIGHNVAKSFAYSNYLQQTTGEWNADMAFAEAYLHLPAVWHNYPEGKVTTCEIIVPNEYEGVSDIPVIDWQISDDTFPLFILRGLRFVKFQTQRLSSIVILYTVTGCMRKILSIMCRICSLLQRMSQ